MSSSSTSVCNDRKPIHEYLLDRRWESLVSGVPSEMGFDENTDMKEFTGTLIGFLDRTVRFIDGIATTDALAGYAVGYNFLHRMEKTCSYLMVTGNTALLRAYITTLRTRFHDEGRWEFFNRNLVSCAGHYASAFIEEGLLDRVEADPDDGRHS
jgi:hypothetical protein